MPFELSSIEGLFIHSPNRHSDARGLFEEQFKLSQIQDELGIEFNVKQVNQSSSSKGVLRGIHLTDSAQGQAKYVSCSRGSVWDIALDLRIKSATYGQWVAQILSYENGKSALIPAGVGHAFLSLEDDTVVHYLCSSEYDPTSERTINPLSPKLAICFEDVMSEYSIEELLISEKDSAAPDFYPK
jgi:dTDP-4-dehydrorhamnose 3,5-epimerase